LGSSSNDPLTARKGVHAALNSLTSPGMVAATLAVLAPGNSNAGF